MNTITATQNSIKISDEPIVILPLKKWQEIGEIIENLEEQLRFKSAYYESRGQKKIGLETLKKKYNL